MFKWFDYMSQDYQYVVDNYQVPACYGRLVIVNNKPGIIIEARGNYIGVNFDTDKPGIASNCHPTWEVIYGDIGKPRKATPAQARYQEYLKSECDENFREWLGIKSKTKDRKGYYVV